MATNANTLFQPRGFSRPTQQVLPNNWVPAITGLPESLTIEGLAFFLSGQDPVTYSPSRLANMTINDMRYAQNIILGYKS